MLNLAETTVHPVQLGDIPFAHADALPDRRVRILRYDRALPVHGESRCTVVHHAAVVVLHVEVCHHAAVVDVEVVLRARLDVLPDDVDELVAIAGTLLMVETESMQELVHHRPDAEATLPGDARRQVKVLGAARVPNRRVAARIGSDHANVGGRIGRHAMEPKARLALE